MYFTLTTSDLEESKCVEIYEECEARIRNVVFENGGCISHHHGVGKLRKRFMEKTVTDMNIKLHEGMKEHLDPKNIFSINNTVYKTEEERTKDLTVTAHPLK